ncbi:metalloendoproteinase 2-MMP-like [Cornus florida]|uniref:metalloendoproteinase 2-MMP-like n=1 Tax=Cornus florida TaxID=4283 RepID=UPI00289E039B|nr:metalloendoproteinase 2-MMP-like [Cornus florida]
MAPNLSLLLGAFLLLLVTVQSKNHTKPPEKGFNFLQHLEGCHKGQTVKGLHELKRYLEKFGYLNYGTTSTHHHSKTTTTMSNLNHANDDEFDNLLEAAVRAYQSNYHLKVTGSLDSETIQEMMLPRCGVPDNIVNATNSFPSRKMKHPKVFDMVAQYTFFPGRPRWPLSKTRLTYSFQSSAQVVGLQTLRSVCSRAFQKWQNVSPFTFVEAPQGATGDIVIGFHRGNHNDGAPFDGSGGTLAHAFAPTKGWFHYDADENWSTNPTSMNQIDLESVAVHEIGHVLGLGHSRDRNAIMFASYSHNPIRRDLNTDDIQGIRALYSS